MPSPPTAPLEIRNLSTNSVIVEWGVPETDGGAPLKGYNVAIRDEKKTMWMEVGRVNFDVQKFNIKDLQVYIKNNLNKPMLESHEFHHNLKLYYNPLLSYYLFIGEPQVSY